MSNIERMLEVLVMPFIDPAAALDEYRHRESLGTPGLLVKSDARPARNALRNPSGSDPQPPETGSGRVP